MQRRHIQAKEYNQVLSLCLKRNDSETSKAGTAKNIFSSLYVVDIICFDERFLLQVITEKHYHRARSLGASDLRSGTKVFRLESGCLLRAEMRFLYYTAINV